MCHDSCLKSQVVRFIFEGSRPFVVKGSALGRGLGSEASFFCNDSCMKSEMFGRWLVNLSVLHGLTRLRYGM